jgi:hypothetical protein
MLRIYRRHRTHCPHTSERYRRCSCPIYVEGSLGAETIRKALDQNITLDFSSQSFEEAIEHLRQKSKLNIVLDTKDRMASITCSPTGIRRTRFWASTRSSRAVPT